MKKSHLELVKKIRDAIRERAQVIPCFRKHRNGAVRILFYPSSEEADEWLGGLSNISVNDIADYEYTFSITPDGRRVKTDTWDGVEQKVDCYAFSALKIAHCSLAQDKQIGLLSGLDLGEANLTEDNGYGPYLGALCVEVRRWCDSTEWGPEPKIKLTDFCGIYVCVSGAASREDLECAVVAIDVIERFFKSEGEFVCVGPEKNQIEGVLNSTF